MRLTFLRAAAVAALTLGAASLPAASAQAAHRHHHRHTAEDADASPAKAHGGRRHALRQALRDEDAATSTHGRHRRHGRTQAAAADADTAAVAEEGSGRKGRRRHGHAAAASESAPAQVTVAKGDTLYSLAKRAHMSVDDLAKLNRLKAPYHLMPGATLALAAAPAAAEEADATPTRRGRGRKGAAEGEARASTQEASQDKAVGRTYVSRRGDTLEAIADRFDVTPSALRKANPDLARSRRGLRGGAQIALPVSAKDTGAERHARGAATEPERTVAEESPRSRRRGARDTEAPTDRSAASIVAEASLTPRAAGRRTRRLEGAAATPTPEVAGAAPSGAPVPAPATAPSLAAATPSPGPRPYAEVFGSAGGGSASLSARERRALERRSGVRGGRTAEDAQVAAAAAARRDYARASIPAAPLVDGGAAAARPRFLWPVSGEVLSGFGPRSAGGRNDGLDLSAQPGDAVRAAAAGQVVYAGNAIPGFGNLVLVKHPGGWVTAYGHLAHIAVSMRQPVRQGETVGDAGPTPGVDRPLVHFEIRFASTPEESAKPVDPAPLLPRRG